MRAWKAQMPVMNGVEAIQRIRSSSGPSQRILIIALTAYAMRGGREKLLQAGMDDSLQKPVDKEELLAVLRRNGSRLDRAGPDQAEL